MQSTHILSQDPLSFSDKKTRWHNLNIASLGLALGQVIHKQSKPFLIVTPDLRYANELADSITFFYPTLGEIPIFPDWETLPYDHFSPHQDIISDRLTILNQLAAAKATTLIVSISTVMHRLFPVSFLNQFSCLYQVGDKLNLDALRLQLSESGYHSSPEVREHGEFAIRGSIIDLFPMGSTLPYRIDLLDDEIESIRTFSVDTQRSIDKLDKIALLPAKEFPMTAAGIETFRQNWRTSFGGNPLHCPIYQDVTNGISSAGIEYYQPLFFDKMGSLFNYLHQDTQLVLINDYQKHADTFWSEVLQQYDQWKHDRTRPILPPNKLFISSEELLSTFDQYHQLIISEHHNQKAEISFNLNNNAYESKNATLNPMQALNEHLNTHDHRVLFCVETLGRREILLQSLQSISVKPEYFETFDAFIQSDAKLGITLSPIEKGFLIKDANIHLISESELYPNRIMQRRLRKKSEQELNSIIRDFSELQMNDPVVHIDHGVGRYQGLVTLTIQDDQADFIQLSYQDDAKLYVPIASLNLLSRYTGADSENAPINRLGSDQWQKSKRKALEKIKDVAAELLEVQAKRETVKRPPCLSSDQEYLNFVSEFPYEETPDQLQAINQVIQDLHSEKPMDRVVCGDVGFGKTEVALRAAFIAAQNGKQVAFLVPTTLLAQQHFEYFKSRFANWPIQVELISRFKSAKEQRVILDKTANKAVDILIGTHKLLQSGLKIPSLGLLIIDEEHRFGVQQKEKLKALRANIDILTLTATPIPRTLNLALSGMRDLSIIATPPAKRLSVKTFVNEYNQNLIKDAILREIIRGGQVYFLHNEVETIHKKADELASLIKEARISVAHGQLNERELERVMSQFYHRQSNVLVCSTIIESGIDIPTANTIIINRSDKFGLAQLHQLRGRVGRSHHQAYAYLLTPPKDHITSDAKKRLEAISKLDQLGVGFSLASHDLEIRGAGELLGHEQSGNIHEIGFSLYMELLNRAIKLLKNGQSIQDQIDLASEFTIIELNIPALIPDTYIHDTVLRLAFYKRIATAKDNNQLDQIQIEMIDRFGLLPDTVKQLFDLEALRMTLTPYGIKRVEGRELSGLIEFNDTNSIQPDVIIKLIQNPKSGFKLDGPSKLRFKLPSHQKNERLHIIKNILSQLGIT